MALHRDIYWVGRQWAVTGYGMQAVDQKQKSKFDIEASRIWEDGLVESLRAEAWFNSEDFSKGLSIARQRYPEPPRTAAAPEERVSLPKDNPVEAPISELEAEQQKAAPETEQPKPVLRTEPPKPPTITEHPQRAPKTEQPKPVDPKFDMHINGWPAKFTPLWRVRIGAVTVLAAPDKDK
jgi:hypothetical protein